MTSKKEAAHNLMVNYLDEYDRVKLSLAPWANSREMKYENSNMLLFSGEALMLLKLNGLLARGYQSTLLKGIKSCEVRDVPGLYNRHPMPYRVSEHFDVISHDEYNGIMYAATATGNRKLADLVCKYGEDNKWEYCDTYPNRSFEQAFMEDPVRQTKNLIKMLALGIQGKEYRFLVEEAECLTYKRLPRDRAFYKIVSINYIPNILEILFMAVSTVGSGMQDPMFKNGSGRMMALYRMWALELLAPVWDRGLAGYIIRKAHSRFRDSLKRDYGPNYVEELHRMYFDRDENHPFLELCKGLL